MRKPDHGRDLEFLQLALDEARTGLQEGGIPIGACLVLDGQVIGRGHNRRVQQQNPILHAELDALQHAGRRAPAEYRRCTIYTTLSPCAMCSGAILLFGIPRVVLAENTTFCGAEPLLRAHGVELVNLDLAAQKALMQQFQQRFPELWREDIGQPQ